MKPRPWISLGTVATTIAAATTGTDTFDSAQPGPPPTGWACGVTGSGTPKWTIEADTSAPTPPTVLKQTGSGTCLAGGVYGGT
ncbi:MAG: hypothetical protein JWO52_4777 [Gammaproteobacteria bacterium]|jgi:hypothetical protein|nr:hypothetical protein [Gammaproteobacteria bacterium]